MEPERRLLARFKPRSEAESDWLNNFYTFISEHLGYFPAPSQDAESLTVSAVLSIQEKFGTAHSLPVSYRFLSVSELVSQQNLSCVSNLSWTTNQYREWAREAELTVPREKALRRVNLLLIGRLTEGWDGHWTLMDGSGGVQCECLSPSPRWLHHPVLLPHWTYIPHNAVGPEESRGHVELLGPPVLLSAPNQQRAGAGPGLGLGPGRPAGVREALLVLQSRVKGQRISVYGEVGSVCPLLAVSGISFFCWSLKEDEVKLPILVKENKQLPWYPCLRVGLHVCVTALRVCVLRGWRGNNILCVTEHSELHTDYTHTAAHGDTHSDIQLDTPCLMMSHNNGMASEGAELEEDPLQSGVRMKTSKVINYQGTVTEVVSEGAGLYMMDECIGLCLAYQPMRRRSLRAGDRVELHRVHALLRPCPDLPPSMLCTCLSSSVTVTAFSGTGGASGSSARCPGDGVLTRLLLKTNCCLSDYLWACHLSSQLVQSLVPAVLRQHQCVCLLSWRLLETLRGRRSPRRRDIYSEMLDESHTCPITRYSVDSSVHQYVSVSELLLSLKDVSSSMSLRSLLPSDGPNLAKSELNSALSWSCKTLTSDPLNGDALRQRPLLLVGVLQLPSRTSHVTLQLSDGTGLVSCVVTESSHSAGGGQSALFNTAWIGCLVCVARFTMVTERFLQSEFPSFQHLDQDKFITHTLCRFYIQFSLDDIHILSPSVAMETHLSQKGEESAGGGAEASGRKRRRTDDDKLSPVAGTTRRCVTLVISVEKKEGVAWKNMAVGPFEEKVELTASFSVRASVIGSVATWGRDPKNGPLSKQETGGEGPSKLLLVFSGASTRWFPVLQPGAFYRLVVLNCQDPGVLIGSELSGQRGAELHTHPTLQVGSDWRFHTLTHPLHTCPQMVSPPVLSIYHVLDCSSEVVCFQGLVSERIPLNDRTNKAGYTYTGVRLTMCDQTGWSLQVYLDLSHTPYPYGLLPGNTLLLSAFQRRVSKAGNVYCSSLPISCVTVLSLGDGSPTRSPPPPMMHLGVWALREKQSCAVGQVKGHLVCFLSLELQWKCSLCDSVYTQSCCGSAWPVFRSTAKVVVDDGSGEASVWFSGVLVRSLLGLSAAQWEGLQRALRIKGHVKVFPRGRSLVTDRDSGDPLLDFLLCVCSSDVVLRPVVLTCRKTTNQNTEDLKTFSRANRDFVTRLSRPARLTCLHLHSSCA